MNTEKEESEKNTTDTDQHSSDENKPQEQNLVLNFHSPSFDHPLNLPNVQNVCTVDNTRPDNGKVQIIETSIVSSNGQSNEEFQTETQASEDITTNVIDAKEENESRNVVQGGDELDGCRQHSILDDNNDTIKQNLCSVPEINTCPVVNDDHVTSNEDGQVKVDDVTNESGNGEDKKEHMTMENESTNKNTESESSEIEIKDMVVERGDEEEMESESTDNAEETETNEASMEVVEERDNLTQCNQEKEEFCAKDENISDNQDMAKEQGSAEENEIKESSVEGDQDISPHPERNFEQHLKSSKPSESLQHIADSTEMVDVNKQDTKGDNSDVIEVTANENSPSTSHDQRFDDKQISDETVSSSNNHEVETGCKLKQNDNIWDKIQMAGQFENESKTTTEGDNSSIKLRDSEQASASEGDVDLSESRDTTDDDIMNFTIELQEDSDEESDKTENASENKCQEKIPSVDDLQANERIEICEESSNSVSDTHDEPAGGNYIHKISSVIRAIDSSKSSMAVKKDRDNIFSVLRAEISTKEKKNDTAKTEETAIVIKDSDLNKNGEQVSTSESQMKNNSEVIPKDSEKSTMYMETQINNSQSSNKVCEKSTTSSETTIKNSPSSNKDSEKSTMSLETPIKDSPSSNKDSEKSTTSLETPINDSPSSNKDSEKSTTSSETPINKTQSTNNSCLDLQSIELTVDSTDKGEKLPLEKTSAESERNNVEMQSDDGERQSNTPVNKDPSPVSGQHSNTAISSVERNSGLSVISPTLRIEGERSFMQALMPQVQKPAETGNTDLSNIKIKTEKETTGYPGDETGDILDILKSSNDKVPNSSNNTDTTSTTNSRPGSGDSNTVTVTGTFQPIRIKQEPRDNFSAASSVSTSSSLEKLSRQVDNLATPKTGSNIAKKSTTKPNSAKRSQPMPPVSNVQNNSNHGYTRLSIPSAIVSRKNMQTVVPPQAKASQQMHRQVPPMSVPPNSVVYPVTPIQNQQSRSLVTSKPGNPTVMSNSNQSIQNVKSLTVVSNGKTISVPVSSVFSVTKILSTPSTVKPTPQQKPMPKSTINIDTVGLNCITELIARKNPIPNYKPPPIPEHLKSIINEEKCRHICYECGDTFLFESSLKVHRARTSMSLSYRCEECKSTKVFFNKCQFLGHLRCHLNIEKTQAVPIHIKSDSISITTLDHGSQMNYLFKWLDDIDTKPESLPTKPEIPDSINIDDDVVMTVDKIDKTGNTGGVLHCPAVVGNEPTKTISPSKYRKPDGLHRCHECGGTHKDLKSHFGYQNEDLSQFLCSVCKKMLPTICSARAHKRIHEEKEPYVCPECGKSFSTLYTDDKMSSQKESFAYHVFFTCFHTCRLTKIKCQKCENITCTSYQDFQFHLSEKLEQYYKCMVCPMAFKLPQSFQNHFPSHGNQSHLPRSFRVIYRCHICDSVMDDKGVLDAHILKHVNEARRKCRAEFCCRFCKEWFKSREAIKKHINDAHGKAMENPTDKNGDLYKCSVCGKSFDFLYQTLQHELFFHSNNLIKPDQAQSDSRRQSHYSKCRVCGIIIFGNTDKTNPTNKSHYCINPNPSKLLANMNQKEKTDTLVKILPKDDKEGTKNKHGKGDNCDRFVCTLCYKEEASFETLQGHLLYHQSKGDMICYHCQNQNFDSLEQLHAHQRVCPLKTKIVSTKKGNTAGKKRKKMAVTSFPSIEYPCDICGFICVSSTDLAKHHKESHSDPGIHPCHLCSSTYESQEMLEKHIAVTHGGKRILLPCQICQKRGIKKVFSTKERLDKHLSQRHRISKNRTEETNFTSTNEVMAVESGTKPSDEISKRKASDTNNSVPVKKLRVDGDNQFTCAKCLYSSNDRSNFVNHLAEHKIENSVQCLECGLSFAVMPSLRKHLFMVHKIRDFENYCKENNISDLPEAKMDDSEIRKGLLLESENEQTDEQEEEETPSNPLECRVCHKVFDSEAAIKSHLRTHGMAFIKNRRSKAPSQGRETSKSEETSDSSSK